MLLIPFEAVTRFFDPSVGFEAKFAVEDEAASLESEDPGPARLHAVPASGEVSTRPLPEADPARQPASPSPGLEEASVDEPAPHPNDSDQNGPKVVSIDAFRKKN